MALSLSRLSRRDRVLIGILAALGVVWLVTIPVRNRLNRETARIERETAARSAMLSDLEKARAEEEAARGQVQQAPNSPKTHLNLASVLGRQRRYPEAVKEIRTALTLDPKS